PIHPMAHEMILSTELTGQYFARRGVLRGDRALGLEVLRSYGRDLMVMPGGDIDTWRPYSKRYEVRFGGRTGYARLALKAGVPILPVATPAAQEPLIVLPAGHRTAQALRLHHTARARISPTPPPLPGGLAIGPWPHLPTPAELRYRIGPAIPAPEPLPPGEEP